MLNYLNDIISAFKKKKKTPYVKPVFDLFGSNNPNLRPNLVVKSMPL